MNPWDETWEWRKILPPVFTHHSGSTGHSGAVVFPTGNMLVKYDPANYTTEQGEARGRLAAAAPEMARVLLATEWKSEVCVHYDNDTASCCPSCGGIWPEDWHVAHDHVSMSGRQIGHSADCAHDAALRKAGVR